MIKVLENLLYTNDHDWVRVEGEKAYIGITDYAQKSLGDIVYVELPELDAKFSKGDTYGVVESVKAATDCFMPISGTVVEVNDELEDSPEKINEDCYGNWILAVEISDKSELDQLINPKDYETLCEELCCEEE